MQKKKPDSEDRLLSESVRVTRTTKVAGKGQAYFVNKFLGGKKEAVQCGIGTS